MAAPLSRGIVVLSIDLERDVSRPSLAGGRGISRVAEQMLKKLVDAQVPVTWSSADPAESQFVDEIRAAQAGHEIALLGESHWVAAGRAKFARELSSRLQRARGAGLSVSSLTLRDTTLTEHFDLLINNKVAALRSSCGPAIVATPPRRFEGWLRLRRSPVASSVRQLQYGLWDIQPAVEVVQGGAFGPIRRAIQSAARDRAISLMTLDVAAFAESGSGLKSFDAMLRLVARCKQEQLINIDSLCGISRLLSAPRHHVSPARSILHTRAA